MTRLSALLLAFGGLAAACSSPPVSGEKKTPPRTQPPELPRVAIERGGILRESSALVVAKIAGATRAFVADEDDGSVVQMDPATKAIVSTSALGTRPHDLLVLADGRLAATLPDASAVALFARDAAGSLREVARLANPAEPIAMALAPDDATLYVTTGASHTLVAFANAQTETRA